MDPTPKVEKLPEVQRTLLKRRKALASGRAKEIQRSIENRRREKPQRRIRFKRLESYFGQAQRQQRDLKRFNYLAKQLALEYVQQNEFVEHLQSSTSEKTIDHEDIKDIDIKEIDQKQMTSISKKTSKKKKKIIVTDSDSERKAAFVVRVRGINQIHPKVRKALVLLNLLAVNRGVFIRLTDASRRLLALCDPYIIWGVPSEQTVRDLIYKRGMGRWPLAGCKALADEQVDKAREPKHKQYKKVPLSDNKMIEECLSEYNIVCTEDIVHQLVTCGTAFRQICAFLLPFRLSVPRGGWHRKSKIYASGGDFGNKGAQINNILQKMI